MPDSGYSSPFFGRMAWTSPIAAILSHRTGSPIMVATTKRKDGRYWIHYSDPIWPNPALPLDQEMDRLMKEALAKLEASIRESPGEWLWSHNRWKQQTPEKLKKAFRHESILIILPQEKKECEALLPHLSTFRSLYPYEFITLYAPLGTIEQIPISEAKILFYAKEADLLKGDERFKLVFNFTTFTTIKPHFKRRSAFNVVSLKDLQRLSAVEAPLSETLKRALLRTYAP